MIRRFFVLTSFLALTLCAAAQDSPAMGQPVAGQSNTQPDRAPGLKKEQNERGVEKKSPKTLLEAITGKGAKKEAESTEGHLDPDRPHLPEASTAVGKGRMLLEGGYTFKEGKQSFSSHGYPEALLRLGMFTDWFEFRIGQSVLQQERTNLGVTSKASGAQDLYLGVKLAATEQRRYLPEIALIPQMTVPTGNKSVTGGKVLPGVNVDASWEIIKDRFGVETVIGANRVPDGDRHSHFELAVGITPVFHFNPKLEAFAEWDAFYPKASIDPAIRPRHYAVGGLVFFATKNFAVDLRAGAGLNAQANRFLIGTGFAFRH